MVKNHFFLLTLLLALLMIMGCENGTDPESKAWELVWEDDFEGPAETPIDTTKWVYDSWGNEIGWGNNQLEWDTDRVENVSLDGDGNLAIVAHEENYMGKQYTSARITTANKFDVEYGRIEARIRLPYGPGIWPAFWMLGDDFDTLGWPDCGEIDIMEYRGQEPSVVHGTVHGPGYSGGQGIGGSYTLDNARFDTEFHLFAIEWDANSIDWFVEDERYFSVSPEDLTGDWVYDHPFFIILNLAIGGWFAGNPTADTSFPQTMLIDYVKVYQESN